MVKSAKYVPDRQDIVWLEFEPQKGKEILKTRPALIISPQEYNHKVGLALCMPITSKVKNYPFEIIIKHKSKHRRYKSYRYYNTCINCNKQKFLNVEKQS